MKYSEIRNIIRWASQIGITTAGELDAYKKRNGIKSNYELYSSLLVDVVRFS